MATRLDATHSHCQFSSRSDFRRLTSCCCCCFSLLVSRGAGRGGAPGGADTQWPARKKISHQVDRRCFPSHFISTGSHAARLACIGLHCPASPCQTISHLFLPPHHAISFILFSPAGHLLSPLVVVLSASLATRDNNLSGNENKKLNYIRRAKGNTSNAPAAR